MKNHLAFTFCYSPCVFLSIYSELQDYSTVLFTVPVTEILRMILGYIKTSIYGQQLDGLEIGNETLCFDL